MGRAAPTGVFTVDEYPHVRSAVGRPFPPRTLPPLSTDPCKLPHQSLLLHNAPAAMPTSDDNSTWSSVFSNPFSDKVLSLLPGRDKAKASARQRSTRQNRIPDVQCVARSYFSFGPEASWQCCSPRPGSCNIESDD
jgi:hypothetical protein